MAGGNGTVPAATRLAMIESVGGGMMVAFPKYADPIIELNS
jgi:hypothetical protein